MLTEVACAVFQARQVLEREFNNLLALGTDRRLEEVTSHAAAMIKYSSVGKKKGREIDWPHFPLCLFRVGMTRLFDALHRGVRGFGHAREGRGWAWWRAPWKRCLLASACPPCPCPPLWTWCPRNSSSLKVRYNTNQTPLLRLVYSSLCFLFGFFLLVLTD